MAKVAVCASLILDGVETTSGVRLAVYPLTTMITNYVASMPTNGSLSRWSEDGQSALIGSVENSSCNRMPYSGLPALHYLSSGWYLCVLSLGLHPLPACPLWMHPIH